MNSTTLCSVIDIWTFYTTCRLFELYGREDKIKLTAKEQHPLQGIGLQKCIAFSVDGTRFATGGVVSYYHCI